MLKNLKFASETFYYYSNGNWQKEKSQLFFFQEKADFLISVERCSFKLTYTAKYFITTRKKLLQRF